MPLLGMAERSYLLVREDDAEAKSAETRRDRRTKEGRARPAIYRRRRLQAAPSWVEGATQGIRPSALAGWELMNQFELEADQLGSIIGFVDRSSCGYLAQVPADFQKLFLPPAQTIPH